jgi:hypothetical protein
MSYIMKCLQCISEDMKIRDLKGQRVLHVKVGKLLPYTETHTVAFTMLLVPVAQVYTEVNTQLKHHLLHSSPSLAFRIINQCSKGKCNSEQAS